MNFLESELRIKNKYTKVQFIAPALNVERCNNAIIKLIIG